MYKLFSVIHSNFHNGCDTLIIGGQAAKPPFVFIPFLCRTCPPSVGGTYCYWRPSSEATLTVYTFSY